MLQWTIGLLTSYVESHYKCFSYLTNKRIFPQKLYGKARRMLAGQAPGAAENKQE
jgi:hypothetical protein